MAQAIDFCMHELIAILYSSVSASPDNPAVLDQNGTYGNSAFLEPLKGLIYCRLHEDVHEISIYHYYQLS
jgi:hypothetical protein